MAQTQIACPRCRQMIPARLEQLFDASANPGAKQRLLSGMANLANCPFCGYQGMLATPIVYHDNDKELLLTYFPAELNLPVNEQEKLIGPLIKQVVDRLPAEKRKGYLLQPKSFLTFQSLVEQILEADGITPEMIQAQQKRLDLLERLLSASSPEARTALIQQEAALLDESFFAIFSRLLQSALTRGQEALAQQMAAIQEQLLKDSELGRKIQTSLTEMEAAAQSLQEVGQELTREKLLDIFIAAPNEDRLRALVSMARPAIDYAFYQMLTDRIEKAGGEERQHLETLRQRLLDYTNEIDRQVEEQLKQARLFLDELLSQADIAEAARQNLDKFTDATVSALNSMLQEATGKDDSPQLEKLQQVVEVLRQASQPPPETALIEQLLDAPDEAAVQKLLEENEEMLTPAFIDALNGLMMQVESRQDQADPEAEAAALTEHLQTVYRAALKYSMRKNL
jgi:phosphoribosyl-ATP pyrophosphohydrolase